MNTCRDCIYYEETEFSWGCDPIDQDSGKRMGWLGAPLAEEETDNAAFTCEYFESRYEKQTPHEKRLLINEYVEDD